MERIRTELEIHAPLPDVYEALSHVENIPLYAPGIREARARDLSGALPEAVGTLVDLVTRSGRTVQGEVLRAERNLAWAVRDANGVTGTWELRDGPEGVIATYDLEGEFSAREAVSLRSEVRSKVARLILELERDEPATPARPAGPADAPSKADA